MVVVIVVDGQQVAVHVGVAHQQLHVGDAVNVLQEAVELIKATRLRAIQREPTKLCTKLLMERKGPREHNHTDTDVVQNICLQGI